MERTPELAPNTLIADRYLVGGVLGRGGAASVYRAEDKVMGVQRALKVIVAPDPTAREALVRRLRDEARAMARLAHPNVLTVHDVGEGDGFDWVVMDLAEGGSLAQRAEAGSLSEAEALRWLGQTLSALQAAHAAGIVHRDVKPQNILVDKYGNALLADFGIALMNQDDAVRSTKTGMAMGSLAYMAPEQRLDARSVTPEADIYATGATLFNLLTGQSPMDLFMVGENSERLAGVPPALRAVIVTATRYEPSRRYASADGMARAMAGALVEPRAFAPPAPLPPPAPISHDPTMMPELSAPTPPSSARWVWSLGVAVLALGIGGLAWVFAWPTAPSERLEAPLAVVAAPPPKVMPMVQSVPPTAEPAAKPAAKPVSVSRVFSTVLGRPLGTLRGTMGGRATTFELGGSLEAVSGKVVVRLGDTRVDTAVTGVWDEGARTLTLRDVQDVPDAGTYTLVFDEALSRFSGKFVRNDNGRIVQIAGGS